MCTQMTDNEIIKGINLCLSKKWDCYDCPFINKEDGEKCFDNLLINVYDLITRQKAEIERLREIRDLCNITILEKDEQIKKLKISDASKEECTIKQHGEIKELKAEVERLQAEEQRYSFCVSMENGEIRTKSAKDYCKLVSEMTAEAIKEFAERLRPKLRANAYVSDLGKHVDELIIDTLVKEMVGDV